MQLTLDQGHYNCRVVGFSSIPVKSSSASSIRKGYFLLRLRVLILLAFVKKSVTDGLRERDVLRSTAAGGKSGVRLVAGMDIT